MSSPFGDLASEVCAEQKTEFLSFVKGDVSVEYLDHLAACDKCWSAVEKTFKMSPKAFEEHGQELSKK